MRSRRGFGILACKESCHSGTRRTGDGGVQLISQHELYAGLTTGQTQVLCLFRGHQQVHNLHLLRLSFAVLLNIGSCG